MNTKIVFNYVGKVLIGFAILFIFPIIVSLYFGESILPFVVPQVVSLLIGIILNCINISGENIYSKDGFAVVAISWIIISIIGAFPIYLNRRCRFC